MFNLLDTEAQVDRKWTIMVTQYECGSNNLPPPGCTQYFSNADGKGIIKSFNFDGGSHLANQKQKICIRYSNLAAANVRVFSPSIR